MAISKSTFNELIKNFDFKNLFIELGWDNFTEKKFIKVSDETYELEGIVEKKGFTVFVCNSGIDSKLPTKDIRKKIDREITKLYHEHLLIYIDNDKTQQLWQLSIREPNKPIQYREFPFYINQEPEILFEKLRNLFFTLDEEDKITLLDVKLRITEQFNQNTERVTKRFYTEFKKHHNAFQSFIEGLENQTDIDWYTSLMLNRLMFVYFIQKKGFLDGNTNYLSDKLKLVKAKKGKDKFYKSFYKTFLLTLFHKGLGKPEHSSELQEEIGKVPYLNGGLFDVHQLEKDNDKLDIKDEAFEKLFDFFNQYNWHLDVRPNASGKDINPDVIGYIFEKYINDRAAMGAYYTKEDITEYISKNTIIPFLFDRIKEKVKNAFAPESSLWKMLKDNPDRYIYDAVKHGIKIDESAIPERFNRESHLSATETEKESVIASEERAWQSHESEDINIDSPNHPLWQDLPDEIKAGFRPDLGKKIVAEETKPHLWEIRKIWNKKAPEEIALPTETYRELIERRKRYSEIKNKILTGEITEINDFITYNLNIRQFAQDAVEQYEGSDFINAFYKAIKNITILDPTAGSGAFLFAALNILEPLYEAVISRMREFVEIDNEKGTGKKYENFRKVLEEIKKHPNEKYYIYKSIILNNLYGVDIMNEAVEIAKLRLFLKLVAVVDPDENDENYGLEPLPDIDFNIRAGNTLVGYATEEELDKGLSWSFDFDKDKDKLKEQMDVVARAFKRYKENQLDEELADFETLKKSKDELRTRLVELNESLNDYLAKDYGIIQDKEPEKYKNWLSSHKPFHWFAEFYEIIHQRGGFDVVIGNPPYVEYKKIDYVVKQYSTFDCANLYAYIVERIYSIINNYSIHSMIIPHSAFCTDRMSPLLNLLKSKNLWVSYFDIRPSSLFSGIDQRVSIYISKKLKKDFLFSTRYYRWHKEQREFLFDNVSYRNNTFKYKNAIAKIGNSYEKGILKKLKYENLLSTYYSPGVKIYYHNSPRYWIRVLDFRPYFWNEKDGEKLSSQIKIISFEDHKISYNVLILLNSSLFYWWFNLLSDSRHLNNRELDRFPFSADKLKQIKFVKDIKKNLLKNFEKNKIRKDTLYQSTGKVKYDEYYPKKSKPIIDEIDTVLAQHYGFTEEELDFIINYDIKYRMGKELDAYIEGKLGKE